MSDTDDSQKTEDPTGRRLQEARESGNVANSREVNNLFMILAPTHKPAPQASRPAAAAAVSAAPAKGAQQSA